MTAVHHYGRLAWSGKFDAVLTQIRIMARRESKCAYSPKPFSIHPDVYQRMETPATEPQVSNSNLSTRVLPLRKAAPDISAVDHRVIAVLDAMKPRACVPEFQDVDADGDHYFKGLSGRTA